MRHSRKAVMKEHYELYLKKYIFNGKYLVRNVQIGIGLVLIMVLIIGVFAAGHISKNETLPEKSADISVKDALFGSAEEEKVLEKTAEAENQKNTTEPAKDLSMNTGITLTNDSEGEKTESKVVSSQDSKTEEQTKNLTECTDSEDEKKPAGSEMAAYYDKSDEVAQAQALRDKESKFSDRCIADVEETLNIRKEPDAESEFVGAMNPGAIARVLGTEGEWTKIKSGDVEGYVMSDYILTGEAAEKFSQDYVTLRGSVLEDGVNVREEATIDSDILQVLNKDDTISVVELPEDSQHTEVEEKEDETSDIIEQGEQNTSEETQNQHADIIWLPVELEDGRTGFVSKDLVDVDELYELAVSAEELQRIAQEEAARRAAEEEAERRAIAQAAAENANNSVDSNSSGNNAKTSADNNTYQGASTTPVTATTSGDCLGTFTVTAYCGCSKCSGGHSKTASGTTPTEGRTIAADTSILPYGTQVVIDGIVYTVEDCGSGVSGNHIDIFFATHEKAMAYGRKSVKVYKY